MTEPLTVVTWLWNDPAHPCRWGEPYTVADVNRVASQVRANLAQQHRFVCFTDQAEGFDAHIETHKIWPCPVGDLGRPEQGGCWRRLKLFDPAMAAVVGPRYLSMDLDCVVTGNLRTIVERKEDLVLWAPGSAPGTPYNGSMWLHRTGTRPIVWSSFNPAAAPGLCRSTGYIGSDQAWLSVVLGPDEAKWTIADGVYHYGLHCQRRLPKGARVVFAPGERKIPPERRTGEPWGYNEPEPRTAA